MLDLYPDQQKIIEDIREHMRRGTKRILLQSPTGSGKTIMASSMLKAAADKGLDCLFIVHRRELIKQSVKAFDKFQVRHGIVSAGFQPDYKQLVQLCSIGSLPRRLNKIRTPKLILWDEASHCASKSWSTVFKQFPDAYHILLTATPERLDGKGLSDFADVIVSGQSIEWLIQNKRLADYDYYNPGKIDMAGVKKEMGDYSKAHSVALVDKPAITGSVVDEYVKHASGKRCLGFAITIEHSNHIVDQFKARGIPAMHLDGSTPMNIRDRVLKDFESGELKYLCNVGLFGEGFDLPGLDAVSLIRPTASLSWYLQAVGRVLRYVPGKQAIIIDHVGNIDRHGLPCRERKWSLEGKAGRLKNGERLAPVKICKKCYGAQPAGSLVCKYCNEEFEVNPREIEEIPGELTKVDKEKMKLMAKQERGGARTYDDLVKLGYARGYKSPEKWAHIINQAREAKRR